MPPVKESDLTSNSFLIPRILIFCGSIRLKPNVLARHYYASTIHNLILGFTICSIEGLQKDLLLHSYKMPADNTLLKTTVFVVIVDLISRIVLLPLYGYLIDKYGRKRICITAYIVTGIAIFFYAFPFIIKSWSPTNPFPWVYIARIIYASGTSMLLIMPFVGDYVEDECKGKALAIQTGSLTIGIVFAQVLLAKISDSIENNTFPLAFAYILLLGIVLVCGISYSSFLKGGVSYYQAYANNFIPDPCTSEQRKSNHTFKVISRVLKRRPWTAAGLILSFLAGMNLGIVCLHHYIITPIPTTFRGVFENVEEQDTVLQYSFLVASFLVIVLEILLDHVRTLYIICVVFFLGLISYSTIWSITNYSDPILFVLVATCFTTCLGFLIMTSYLEYKYCPRILRGRSFGIKLMVLVLGMLITVVMSGLTNGIFITDVSNRNAVIYLMLGSTVLGFIIFLLVYCKRIKEWEIESVRKQGTGIKTLVLMDGADSDILDKSDYEKHLLDDYRQSSIRNFQESLMSHRMQSDKKPTKISKESGRILD